MDWIESMDKLKRMRGFTDEQLGAELGISASWVRDLRGHRREMPGEIKIDLIDKLGYAMTAEVILSIFPKKNRDKIIELENKRARERANRKLSEEQENDD